MARDVDRRNSTAIEGDVPLQNLISSPFVSRDEKQPYIKRQNVNLYVEYLFLI